MIRTTILSFIREIRVKAHPLSLHMVDRHSFWIIILTHHRLQHAPRCDSKLIVFHQSNISPIHQRGECGSDPTFKVAHPAIVTLGANTPHLPIMRIAWTPPNVGIGRTEGPIRRILSTRLACGCS
jgi:hypothetical protein